MIGESAVGHLADRERGVRRIGRTARPSCIGVFAGVLAALMLNGCACGGHACTVPILDDVVSWMVDMSETDVDADDARLEPMAPVRLPATREHPAMTWHLMQTRSTITKSIGSTRSYPGHYMPMGIAADGRIACASNPQKPRQCITVSQFRQGDIGDINWKRLEPNFCPDYMFAPGNANSCTDARKLLKVHH